MVRLFSYLGYIVKRRESGRARAQHRKIRRPNLSKVSSREENSMPKVSNNEISVRDMPSFRS